MLAFHNQHSLKTDVLMRTRIGRDTGTMWRQGDVIYDGVAVCGCAVGLQMQSDQWDDFETKLGLPLLLADLESAFFNIWLEGKAAYAFPARLMEAIPVGADIGDFAWQLSKAVLRERGLDQDLDYPDRDALRSRAQNWGREISSMVYSALYPDLRLPVARKRYVYTLMYAMDTTADHIAMAERLIRVVAAMPVPAHVRERPMLAAA